MNIVPVCHANRTDAPESMIDAAAIELRGADGAEPTSRCLSASAMDCWAAEEWAEDGTLPDGRKCRVYYLFSEQDVGASGEDNSALPFDAAHVDRVELCC